MATNRVREHATRLSLPVPSGTESGDALVIGALPCVAVTDRDTDTAGSASVQTDGSWSFPVHGEDGAGNAAIALGAILYIDTDGEINADVTNGKRFGYALEALASGETRDIEVKVGY